MDFKGETGVSKGVAAYESQEDPKGQADGHLINLRVEDDLPLKMIHSSIF